MNDAREIQVHMCALAIGQGNDVLRATLGSCVGIGLLWRERAIYGLAHCLLPDAPVLAGGANMVHYTRRPAHPPIGEQNVRTAQQLLEALGVRVVHVDAGGECGRQLLIDCQQHTFVVKKIARTL